MPVLTLRCSPLPPAAVQARLGAALTRLTAELLGKRPEVTAVLLHAEPAAWCIGGEPSPLPTAWLEISITAGTNSVAEKANFIAQAQALLQAELAPGGTLAAASYVVVRELPATDWGYAGLTQDARRRASPPVPVKA